MSDLFTRAPFSYRVFLSSPSFSFLKLQQVHGKVIVNAKDVALASSPPEADGFLLLRKEAAQLPPLCIKTADCGPLLLFFEKEIFFLHVGYKSLHKGIIQEAFSMASSAFCKSYLGPCIRSCCYEVQEDFKQLFPHSQHFLSREGKIYFELSGEIRETLGQLSKEDHFSESGQCTFCQGHYHSARRDKGKERNMNILVHNDHDILG